MSLHPPESWPEDGQQLYREFEALLHRRLEKPRGPLRQLFHFFRQQQAEGLSYREFPLSLWDRYRESIPPKSQNSCYSALRRWLKFLYYRQVRMLPLHEELSRPPNRGALQRGVLSYEQVMKLMNLPRLDRLTGLRDRAYLEMAYAAGLRCFEQVALDVTDLDLVEGHVWLRRTKNREERVVPLTKWAIHFLERYLREARPLLLSPLSLNALWLGNFGQRLHQHFFAARLAAIYHPQKNLGFRVNMHQLRHACATHMLVAGAELRIVQQLLGHQSLTSTQVYTRITPLRLQEVHRRCHPRNDHSAFLLHNSEGPGPSPAKKRKRKT